MSAADDAWLEQRPVIVAIAGPNGAGKSTFYEAHLRSSALRFINADDLSRALEIDIYRAAEAAERLRNELVASRESFVFETVFSDPAQAKIAFLKRAAAAGYTVALCFIGLASAELSDQRVTLRVLSGGHDVPREKLLARYPRSLVNLEHALAELPFVRIFDNSLFGRPHRQIAEFRSAALTRLTLPAPTWFVAVAAPALGTSRRYTVESSAIQKRQRTLVLAAADGSRTTIEMPSSKDHVYRRGDRVRIRVTRTTIALSKA